MTVTATLLPYTDEEMDGAMDAFFPLLWATATRHGRPIGEYVESEEFGLHAMAYVLALRENAPAATLHARALARFLQMRAQGPRMDVVMEHLTNALYTVPTH
ncbi:hypothetical protein [Streptomyces sp. SS]|uniref:hypothetical protein n=1 Tax=Streptomyces sp. SS TaxID=260742 RepID=UPI000314E70F|nr:hypothetical protein [Streptomyces sp. SS]